MTWVNNHGDDIHNCRVEWNAQKAATVVMTAAHKALESSPISHDRLSDGTEVNWNDTAEGCCSLHVLHFEQAPFAEPSTGCHAHENARVSASCTRSSHRPCSLHVLHYQHEVLVEVSEAPRFGLLPTPTEAQIGNGIREADDSSPLSHSSGVRTGAAVRPCSLHVLHCQQAEDSEAQVPFHSASCQLRVYTRHSIDSLLSMWRAVTIGVTPADAALESRLASHGGLSDSTEVNWNDAADTCCGLNVLHYQQAPIAELPIGCHAQENERDFADCARSAHRPCSLRVLVRASEAPRFTLSLTEEAQIGHGIRDTDDSSPLSHSSDAGTGAPRSPCPTLASYATKLHNPARHLGDIGVYGFPEEDYRARRYGLLQVLQQPRAVDFLPIRGMEMLSSVVLSHSDSDFGPNGLHWPEETSHLTSQ